MQPLVILDLYSAADGAAGAEVVLAHHRYTSPERPVRVIQPDGDLEALRGAAGIQVTGSPLMLNTLDTPWQDQVGSALEAAAGRGIPVLGVCFGHQLIGQHFGATLRSWDGNRWGVADVAFAGAAPEGPFAQLTRTPMVFTHRDHLIDAGDMRSVASGGLGGMQALEHPDLPIWTIQGHPEADARLCVAAEGRRWTDRYAPASVDTPASKRILANFGRLMQHSGASIEHPLGLS